MNGKYKLLTALTILVVFSLGVVAGIFGDRYLAHKRPERSAAPRQPYPMFDDMIRELGLTEEQQAAIKEVFRRNEERFKTLRFEFHKNLGEMRGLLKEEIDRILTPEQIQKMGEMIHRYQEMNRRDSGKKKPDDKDLHREQDNRSQSHKGSS